MPPLDDPPAVRRLAGIHALRPSVLPDRRSLPPSLLLRRRSVRRFLTTLPVRLTIRLLRRPVIRLTRVLRSRLLTPHRLPRLTRAVLPHLPLTHLRTHLLLTSAVLARVEPTCLRLPWLRFIRAVLGWIGLTCLRLTELLTTHLLIARLLRARLLRSPSRLPWLTSLTLTRLMRSLEAPTRWRLLLRATL